MTNLDPESHWNKVYDNKQIEQLGWYEENPEPSLNLIKDSQVNKDATILNVGVGATTLVDKLLDHGYSNIIAHDISASALEKLKWRLANRSEKIIWIVDDLTKPDKLLNLDKVDLWHDRAVLHFFTEEKDRQTYFNLLKSKVKLNAYVIIAVFNLNSATKCSGLPVFRYDLDMLRNYLGEEFTLLDSFDYTYQMPSGDTREYIYTLFKRFSRS